MSRHADYIKKMNEVAPNSRKRSIIVKAEGGISRRGLSPVPSERCGVAPIIVLSLLVGIEQKERPRRGLMPMCCEKFRCDVGVVGASSGVRMGKLGMKTLRCSQMGGKAPGKNFRDGM